MKILQFEKHIEQTIVFLHIESIPNKIKQYRLAYTEFIRERNSEPSFNDYIHELVENEQKYPLLSFFTVTRSDNDINDEFCSKFYLLRYENVYPITDFVLKHLVQFEIIQLAYPIVNFTNYLLQKYNHRLLRNEAATSDIQYYLTSNDERQVSEQFCQAWYRLTLNEIRYNCQIIKFSREQSIEQFSKSTKLAFFLLNASKDNSSIAILGCLQTLAKLQNTIVNYYRQIDQPVNELIEDEKNVYNLYNH
ncbi:unnamed protein product [Didymodactylos carnosus]|uniref:Uncharacterized protein n=1 Tax=Didymodactylos carnosus TaxID=1234261 RepID=A0A814QRX3_9BILA|nr:unnamed protein product [Didymodactylos carnosus]CAF3886308.1 unnamed protein product [Didymodactylos carnosus]